MVNNMSVPSANPLSVEVPNNMSVPSANPPSAEVPNNMSVPSASPLPAEVPGDYLYTYIVVRLCLSCLAISGNSLTVLAVCRFSTLRSATNLLFCSLAVADLMAAFNVGPKLATSFLGSSSAWYPSCLTAEIICVMVSAGSIYSILAIAIDRYLFIAYPFRYSHLVTQHRALVTIACFWLWICIMVPVPMALSNRLHISTQCHFQVSSDHVLWFGLYFSQAVVVTAAIMVIYTRIACVAWVHSRRIANQDASINDNVDHERRKREWNITKMTAIMLGCYFIAVLPSVFIHSFSHATPDEHHFILDIVCEISCCINCWVNPFIYAWKCRDMRHAFRVLLHCRVNVVKPDPGTSDNNTVTSRW